MKHLNPRQGITTEQALADNPDADVAARVKHLNPRQGITTLRQLVDRSAYWLTCETPKSPPGDYNSPVRCTNGDAYERCVKHLNPRQGITMFRFPVDANPVSIPV